MPSALLSWPHTLAQYLNIMCIGFADLIKLLLITAGHGELRGGLRRKARPTGKVRHEASYRSAHGAQQLLHHRIGAGRQIRNYRASKEPSYLARLDRPGIL